MNAFAVMWSIIFGDETTVATSVYVILWCASTNFPTSDEGERWKGDVVIGIIVVIVVVRGIVADAVVTVLCSTVLLFAQLGTIVDYSTVKEGTQLADALATLDAGIVALARLQGLASTNKGEDYL